MGNITKGHEAESVRLGLSCEREGATSSPGRRKRPTTRKENDSTARNHALEKSSGLQRRCTPSDDSAVPSARSHASLAMTGALGL